MDKEFDAEKEHVPFLQVNMTVARGHVGKIELKIRTVKERVWFTTGEIPFQTIPTMVFIYTIYNVALRLNTFPIRSGITGGFSPRELGTGSTMIF